MKNNPECFRHCPRILDAAERVARLGRTGVVQAESVVKQPTEALIRVCEEVANSDCENPIPRTPSKETSLLGRLGLINVAGSDIEYTCGITGQGPHEKRYLFRDTL